MAKPRQVRCPNCGGDALWAPENPWRPFCSERCKQIEGDIIDAADILADIQGEDREVQIEERTTS